MITRINASANDVMHWLHIKKLVSCFFHLSRIKRCNNSFHISPSTSLVTGMMSIYKCIFSTLHKNFIYYFFKVHCMLYINSFDISYCHPFFSLSINLYNSTDTSMKLTFIEIDQQVTDKN